MYYSRFTVEKPVEAPIAEARRGFGIANGCISAFQAVLQLVFSIWAIVLYAQNNNALVQDTAYCSMRTNLNLLLAFGVLELYIFYIIVLAHCFALVRRLLFNACFICLRIGLKLGSLSVFLAFAIKLFTGAGGSSCSKIYPTLYNDLSIFVYVTTGIVLFGWIFLACCQCINFCCIDPIESSIVNWNPFPTRKTLYEEVDRTYSTA